MLKPPIAFAAALVTGHACAERVQIAVAANFAPPTQKIAAEAFKRYLKGKPARQIMRQYGYAF